MVKPELKCDKPKLLAPEASENSNMEEGSFVTIKDEDGEFIVAFDETRGRKGPRICVFVGLFVFVLVVGFLSVYLIGRTHGNKREHSRGVNMADDIARVPTQSPGLANASKLWQKNASWETHEEVFQLSDAIGSSDIIGLKPIYRKDLPSDYIAYWEVKLNSKTGEKYMVISAAKETGDHRLAEEGSLPSPLDRMSDSAMMFGHSCHRVYRLTPDGLMICEDTTTKRIVAATRDVETDSVFDEMKWRKLDKQVQKALPRLKKVWRNHAKRVTKLPQWKKFNWLSMKSGQRPEKSHHDEDDDDDDDDKDGIVEELGIKPGDMFQIPLGSDNFPKGQCRIKFVGLRNTKTHHSKRRKTWSNRWQRRLCRVLDDACEGSDLTLVKQRYVKQTVMGDRYVKLQIRADSRYVRKQLQGQEVRFRIEIRANRKKSVVIHYGIILKNSRTGRSLQLPRNFSIPHKELFPSYKQHHLYRHCWTGSASVSWGMVLGYINNMGHRYPELGYPKNIIGNSSSPLPLTMDKTVELFIQKIYSALHTACAPGGAADNSLYEMRGIKKLLNDKTWRVAIENDRESSTWRAIKMLKQGIPVIVSKQRGTNGLYHYAVATQLRQRHQLHRQCTYYGICSDWRNAVESDIFVHSGLGPKDGRWENADAFFMAAIFKS